jgi:WD40 repeat protein
MVGHDIEDQISADEREPGAWGVPGTAAHIEAIAFNQKGTRIVTASYDRTVRIWDAETADELIRIRHECRGLSGNESVAFRPDGKLIALAWGSKVMIFNAESGDEPFTAPGHSISFHPDGAKFAVGSDDDVTILDTAQRKQLHTLDVKGQLVEYSPDGSFLVVGSTPASLIVASPKSTCASPGGCERGRNTSW